MRGRLTFWEQVEKTEGCWIWTGATNGGGYGSYGRKLAHRYAYEEARGPIPRGKCIDHLCRVRRCVRPEHLEVVDQSENVRRGLAPKLGGAASRLRAATRTHCRHGHPWTEESTYWWNGHRRCRPCNTALVLGRQARERAEAGFIPYAERTHCKHGHEWTPENTYVNRAGSKVCRTCQRANLAAWKAARASASRAG